jgi:ABC-type lipoprotein release transport system permease subunit
VLTALGATRLLRTLLYGVEPADPVTFVAIVGVLALAGLAATWLPARRATRVDPVEAIRAE